jgi:ribosomal protein L37AE/L43A
LPPVRRPARFVYECSSCGVQVPRQRQGTWSCSRCAPRFDPKFLLHLQSVSGGSG